MPRISGISKELAAFLDLIAWSEGTSLIPDSDDGYRVLVGSTPSTPHLFEDYTDHPRIKINISRLHKYSTAAGRYQIIAPTWDDCKKYLNLKDFSPVSQDVSALRLMRLADAYPYIQHGLIGKAITACSGTWASFPGSRAGQGGRTLAELLDSYHEILGRE